MAIVDELISVLGYEVRGEDNLRRFEGGMTRMRDRAQALARGVAVAGAAMTAAIGGAVTGMMKLATDASGPLDEMIKFSDRVGENFEALQEWGFAAEQNGASAGEFQSAVQSMSRQLAEAARGTGRAKKALEDYGLSATDTRGNVKTATDFMSELADKMQGMSEQQALDLGTKLGMSPGMVTLLRQGNSEIEKLRQQSRDAGLIFTEKDARLAEQFNDSLNLFQLTTRALRFQIGIGFLPVLRETIDQLQSWHNANREVIRSGIDTFVRAIVTHFQTLKRVLLETEISPLWQMAGAVVLMATRVGRIAALALALEDILNYMADGDSYFGDFVQWLQDTIGVSEDTAEKIAGIGAAILAIGLLNPRLIFAPLFLGIRLLAPQLLAAVAGMFALLGTPAGWLIIIGGVAAAIVAYFWDDLKNYWNSIEWSSLGTIAKDAILAGFAGVGEWIDANVLAPVRNAINSLRSEVPDAPLPIVNELPTTLGMGAMSGAAAFDRFSTSTTAGAGRLTSDMLRQSVTNNVDVTVNQTVQQATDAPGAAARATGDAVGRAAIPESSRTQVPSAR